MAALLLAALPAHAGDRELAGAAWVAESAGTMKVSAGTYGTLLNLTNPANVSTVALDPLRRVVWIFAQPRLYALDFTGLVLSTTTIPGTGTSSQIVVRPSDGSIWLGLDSALHNVSAGGQLLRSVTGPGVVKELAISDPVLWVATASKVTKHDVISGAQIGSLTDLGSNPSVKDISVKDGDLFVALSSTIRWYNVSSGSNTFVASISLSGALFIERTQGDSLWVVKSSELVWVRTWSPTNIVISSQGNPFAKSETPVAFTGTGDNDLWIGTSKSRLLSGQAVTLPTGVTIRDLASFPREASIPQVQFSSSGWTTDPLKPVGLAFYDTGSGPDPATLNLSPAGRAVCQTNEEGASCTPSPAWAEGVWNAFTASIKDYAGNLSTTASGGIGLDATAPALAITSPANGAVLTNPATPIAMTYSDAASGVQLTSFQIAATGGPAVTFNCTKTASSASCVAAGGLPDGIYTITASIRDNVGNLASRAITVTMGNPADTTPPTISFKAPGAGRLVADATPLLRVSYADTGGGPGGGIDPPSLRFTQGGQPLAVVCNYTSTGAGCVPQSPVAPGSLSVSASVADLAGNRSTAASVSFSIVAPITEVRGVVRLANGSPAAGAQVFLVGKPGMIVNAASDGSFVLPAIRALPGDRLAIGVRAEAAGATVVGGVNNVTPAYPTTTLQSVTLGPPCALSFSKEFPPGQGLTNSRVIETAVVFDDGTGPALYVGGTFNGFGGIGASYVARWTTSGWSSIGGTNGEVKALAVFDDGTGPALYAAGSFSSAGTGAASNVARWDGTAWSPLGGGLSNAAFALAVFDDGTGPALYAAGGFISAGGGSAAHVARWDGFAWSPLGAGLDGTGYALAVFDDGNGPALYAGGSFTHAGGTDAAHAAARVARWSGQTWSPLAAGVSSTASTLAVFDDGSRSALAAGGYFTSAGAAAANFVARWDGTSWRPLGLGLDSNVEQLGVFDDGTGASLYAVGTFPAGLLRWDGTRWRGVGGGLGSWARSLAADASAGYPAGLFVGGGTFTTAGLVPSEGVARWRRTCADETSPTVRITTPLQGVVTAASTIAIAGTVSEQATVTVGGTSTPVDAQGSFSRSVSLVEGGNTFAVVATDAAGNTSRADVKVLRDSVAPTLKFLYPVGGLTLTTALPRVELAFNDVSGADPETLTLTVGAVTLSRVCSGGSDLVRCQLATPLPNGAVTLTARVRDVAGNLSAPASISLTVTPSAASGTTTISGSVGLIGGAPVGGARVTIQGQPGASAISGADGSFLVPAVLATAGQALTAIARLDSADTQVAFGVVAVPVLGGVSNAGRITLRPVCPAAFDTGFVAGYGLDGDYPWKTPQGYDTYFKTAVRALAVYDDGSGLALFVGGSFKQAGGLPANFIAKFDGTRWSALGNSSRRGAGTNNYVQTLAVFNDGSGPALYAGGYFTWVDGISTTGIARWNGTAWSPVGGGIGGTGVTALAVWNNALYAAGRFTSAGGVAARNIAKWNGTSWSALGSGLGESWQNVYALVEHKKLSGSGTALYAGGDFTVSGTAAMKRIAAWDGSSWREVGGGLGTATSYDSSWFNVSTLMAWKGDLYAGGWFSGAGTNGSIAVDSVARWDGRNWSAVGNLGGTGCQCIAPLGLQSLLPFNDGTVDALYALGDVSTPTITTCGALRWNGTAWSAPGNGPYRGGWGGSALRAFDDPTDGVAAKLFAGSEMTAFAVTNQPVKGLATWDGSAWRPVGSGIAGDVLALARFDDGSGPALYAVGAAAQRMSLSTPPSAGRPLFTDLPALGGVGKVLTVVDLGSGPQLYVAGSFATSGSLPVSAVARWTGAGWAPLGDGLGTTSAVSVEALASLATPAGRRLVAAGTFDIGGRAFYGVAQWDGAAWAPLSTRGLGGAGLGAFALAEYDDGTGNALYAGGDFQALGGEPALRIARWNGNEWSAVGSGVGPNDGTQAAVGALAAFDDGSGRRLYAALHYWSPTGSGTSAVLRWDGAAWTTVGATFDGAVQRLLTLDDGTGAALYAIGPFTMVGSTIVNRIARWNGTAWVAAGSDLGSGTVHDLVAFDDGTGPALFAGGRFAYGNYGKRTDFGYLGDSGEVYYLAKLRRPLVCSAPDTTPPTLAITSPVPGAVVDTQTPSIIFSYADGGSGVDTSTLAVTANGASLALSCSYGAAGATCVPTAPIPEGQVNLAATIRDAAGNKSSTAAVSFRVSVGAPSISIVSPAENELLADTHPRLTMSYSSSSVPSTLDLQVSPTAIGFNCSYGGNEYTCDPTTPFPEGTSTVTATIRNGAGQVSDPAVRHFTVDTLPPTISFLAPAAGATAYSSHPVLRLALIDDGAGIDPASLEVREGSVVLASSCTFHPASADCSATAALSDGLHTLTAAVRDRAGKAAQGASVTFTVDTSDTTPPTIVLTVPGALVNQTQTQVSGSVSEPGSVTVNGAPATVDAQLGFSLAAMPLLEGPNAIHVVATDLSGSVGTRDFVVVRDTGRPLLSVDVPAPGELCSAEDADLAVSWSDAGSGVDPTSLAFVTNGFSVSTSCRYRNGGADCVAAVLPAGSVSLTATVRDRAGNVSQAASATCVTDPGLAPPKISIYSPAANSQLNTPQLTILGQLSKAATLTVNGQPVDVAADLGFQAGPFTLSSGPNVFSLQAQDSSGTGHASLTVTFDGSVPSPVDLALVTIAETAAGRQRVAGAPGAVAASETGTAVVVQNLATHARHSIVPAPDGSFETTVGAFDGDTLRLTVRDAAGNESPARDLHVSGTVPVPADPPAAAPPLDPSASVDACGLVSFYWTGAQPVQFGVDPQEIDCERLAVVHGRVLDRIGAPLAGVRVEAADEPEYGATFTRADGAYDLALRAHGRVVLRFSKPGTFSASRTLALLPQQFSALEDVALVAPDPQVTAIEAGYSGPQVVRGSAVSDDSGSRQTTVLVPAGTTAALTVPGGGPQPIGSLQVRATELTVGPEAWKAMPATPPSELVVSYAVELSVDAAEALGATVQFSRALPVYFENYRGAPVGDTVAVATLDRATATWVPVPDGRVIKLLSVTAGVADVDVSGSGQPASASELEALGIDDAERGQLAALYSPGQSLVRFAVTHFSDYVTEWYVRLAQFHAPEPIGPPPVAGDEKTVDHPTVVAYAGAIESENQVLRESIGVVGTPFTLHYRSDRVPGRRAPYRLSFRLSGPLVPPSVLRIDLEIDIAGQHYKRSFPPTPGLTHEFVWDRLDGYGREVPAQAPWTATVTYVRVLDRPDLSIRRTFSGTLGALDAAAALGLGGWTLDAHHYLDRPSGTLYYGDGRRRTLRSAANNPRALERVAGTGGYGSSGDGGDARRARLKQPSGLSVMKDGSLLIADYNACRVRKVSAKDGTISTIAGSICADSRNGVGDGGPATSAVIWGPSKAIEGADGSIYIADLASNRIRRVDPTTGIITTVAGNGQPGCTGNQVAFPHDLALGADGAVLIANEGYGDGCDSIQKYTPGNGLETVVGDHFGPAGSYSNAPQGVAAGPNGTIYWTPVSAVVRRPAGGADDPQHPNWIIAGVNRYYGPSDPTSFDGDGEQASYEKTRFFLPTHLAVGHDGTVYIADRLNQRIRIISPAERVDTFVGGGTVLPVGDGIAPAAARLADPIGVALDEKRGVLYFSDGELHQVWKVRLGELPKKIGDQGVQAATEEVPEEDGSVVYVFDQQGHHLETKDAITGHQLLTFTYTNFPTSGGRTRRLLTKITDASGDVTTILRSGNGDATSITGPYGQETSLQIDAAKGYLTQASGGGATVGLTHDSKGLLRSLVDPRSGTYTFDYDGDGRLKRAADPAGGSLDLVLTTGPSSWKVRQSTAMGRTSEIEVFLQPEDATITTPLHLRDRMLRIFTDAAGLKTELHETADAQVTVTAPDGTTGELSLAEDPLLEDLARYTQRATTTTPGGLSGLLTASRPSSNATTDSNNRKVAADTWTETAVANGRSSSSKFTKSDGVITQASPASRNSTMKVDAIGRVTEAQVPGVASVSPGYDERGRLANINQGGRTTTWSYDGQGYVRSVTDPLLRTVTFDTDAQGRVTKQTLPGQTPSDQREIRFAYDDNGNLISLTPPDRPPHTFGYDPVDQVESAIPPAVPGGGSTAYAYNADHQLELITRPDGATIDPAYDGTTGRLVSVTTPSGTTSIGYDSSSGRVASVSAPAGGGTITYSYDGPVLTGVAQSGVAAGSVTYTRDTAETDTTNFWIASRTINGDGAGSVSFQYDRDGLLTSAGPIQLQRDSANGLLTGTTLLQTTETLERNNFGELTHLQTTSTGTGCSTGCAVLDQTYTRDAAGRITGINEILRDPNASTAETHPYVYTFDAAGRLTQVKRDGAVWETFGYDTNSNRTSWTGPWGTGTATYDAQDRLLTHGTKSFTYTANGELLTKSEGSQTVRYTYDVLGNLRRVQLADGTAIDYVIDAANRRIAKKVAGALVKGFLYGTGSSPVAELDGSGNVISAFIYAAGGNVPDAIVRGGVTYRIVTDHLGSVRWVLNAETGAVAQRIDYDPFGHVTLDSNPAFQPFGFAGGLYDYQTGLVRFGARDYDAEVGRWTTKDPIGFHGNDANLYGYAFADPVNNADPTGLWPVGHHYVPRIVRELPELSPEAKAVFARTTTGPLDSPNLNQPGYNAAHRAYDRAVKVAYDQYLTANGINASKMTAAQAESFVGEVRSSPVPAISTFLEDVEAAAASRAARAAAATAEVDAATALGACSGIRSTLGKAIPWLILISTVLEVQEYSRELDACKEAQKFDPCACRPHCA